MKKFVLYGLTALCLFFIPAVALPAQPVSVEILYMNHGPLQSTIKEIRALCGGYGKALTVAWYDSESPEGEKFMAKKGIHEHVPLVVWIAGKTTVERQGERGSIRRLSHRFRPRLLSGEVDHRRSARGVRSGHGEK